MGMLLFLFIFESTILSHFNRSTTFLEDTVFVKGTLFIDHSSYPLKDFCHCYRPDLIALTETMMFLIIVMVISLVLIDVFISVFVAIINL